MSRKAYTDNYALIDWSKDLGPTQSDVRRMERSRQVISDDLGADLEHHGYSDGRRTASKSVFRRWTREAGLVEKGNDRVKTERRFGDPDTKGLQRDVAQAIEMVNQGYRPQIRWREDG